VYIASYGQFKYYCYQFVAKIIFFYKQSNFVIPNAESAIVWKIIRYVIQDNNM